MEILSEIALKIFGLFFIIMIFLDWPWGNFNCIPVHNWFFFPFDKNLRVNVSSRSAV